MKSRHRFLTDAIHTGLSRRTAATSVFDAVGSRGFTLLELVLAMVVSSILLLGLGSALSLATRSVRPDSATGATLEAASAVRMLQDDLRFASRVMALTSQSIDVITTDYDTDGNADRVRYQWSGVSGDPLMRKINDGVWYIVCPSVEGFQIQSHFQSAPERYRTPPTVGNVILLDQYTSGTGTSYIQVNSDSPVSQFIHPDRFVSSVGMAVDQQWRLTQLEIYSACTSFYWNNSSTYTLTRSTMDGLPTQEYLFTQSFNPLQFSGGQWRSIDLEALPWLNATDGVNVRLSYNSGYNRLNIPHSTAAGDGFATTAPSSSTNWQRPAANRSLLFKAYGQLRTKHHTEETSGRSRFHYADIALDCPGLSSGPLHAAVNFLNQPWNQILHADADFIDSSTNGDLDFDGSGDLIKLNSSGIVSDFILGSMLGDLQQSADTKYRLAQALPTGKTLDVRFTSRDPSQASGGPLIRLASGLQQDGSQFSISAAVQQESDGTQTVSILQETDTNQFQVLETFRQLENTALEIRILLDVQTGFSALWLNGLQVESFRLTAINSPGLPSNVQIQAYQSDAEFYSLQIITRSP